MKKICLVLCAALLAAMTLVACGPRSDNDVPSMPKVNVYVPNGTPAFSIAQLITEMDEIAGHKVTYTVLNDPAGIGTKILNKEADVAIVPINMAAKLYNNGVGIRMAATTVQGCLYLVGTQSAAHLSDLVGKVVYNIGEQQVPDIVFRYLLKKNGIDYEVSATPVSGKVALQYVSAGPDLVGLFKTNKAVYGILPEPVATQALSAVEGLTQLFDLQQEWKTVENTDKNFPLSCLVVREEVKKAFVKEFVAIASASEEWLKQHIEEAKTAITAAGGTVPALTPAIIDRSNLSVVKAADAKDEVERYLQVLRDFDEDTIGGGLPEANFYYTFKEE